MYYLKSLPILFSKPSGPPVFDADYQAILDYATTQGWTLPSSGMQTKGNQLVLNLKTYGIWSKTDVLYIYYTDGDVNFAGINWKAPGTFTTSRVNSPVFATNEGFKSNGTSSYLNTTFNCATNGVNYTQDNASQFLWIHSTGSSGSVASTVVCGLSANNGNNFFLFNGNGQRVNMGTAGNTADMINFTGTGFKINNRTSSNDLVAYNNTTQTITTAASQSVNSSNSTVLRRSTGGYNTIDSVVAVYGLGASLATESIDFYNSLNTYMS